MVIDIKTREYKRIVKRNGGIYIGIQKNPYGEDLILFNDPLTGSTLGLKVSVVTGDSIQRKIREVRKMFAGKK